MKQVIFIGFLIFTLNIFATAQNEKSVCPKIEVNGGGVVNPGQPMQFSVEWSEETKKFEVEYEWTISAGTIVSGQGTNSITVDTTGIADQTDIVATAKIKGLPENCAASFSETGTAMGIRCGLLSQIEYGKVSWNEERSRLDMFFSELANNPNDYGVIQINVGKDEPLIRTKKHIKKMLSHVRFRKLSEERLIFAVRNSDSFLIRLYRILEKGNIICDDCQIIDTKDL